MKYYCNSSSSLSLFVLMLAITTTPGTSDSVGAEGGLSPQPKLQQLLLRGASAARSAEVKVEEVQRTSATTAATDRRLEAAKTETGDDPMKTKNKDPPPPCEVPKVDEGQKTTDAATTTAAAVTTAKTTATTPAVITCKDVCPTKPPDWENDARCDMEAHGDCYCHYLDSDCQYLGDPFCDYPGDPYTCFFTCMRGKWYMGCHVPNSDSGP